jgi:GxxExxY protein
LFCLLKNKGIKVDRQKLLPIKLDDISIPSGLKLDLLVADSVIVELKAVERLLPIHEAQIHTYMKISKMPLGLLINFNVPSLKNGIKRIAMAQHQIENFV